MGVWLLVAALHLTLDPPRRMLTWPLSYMILELLACLSLAYRAWSTPGESRLAWWLLALSAFLEVPNLIVTFLQLHGDIAAWGMGLRNILSLASGILVLAGVLSFPKGGEQGVMFRRRSLDGLVFAASLLFLLWVMGVQGSLHAAKQSMGLRLFVAYLNVALLGGGLVFITSYHPDRVQGPLGWLGASALAWLAALSCWTLAGLPPVVATQNWVIIAGAIPLFQALAACSPGLVEEGMVPAEPGRRAAGLLPYLPVFVTVVVLAAMLIWSPQKVTREAYAIFLAMVMLLLLRQLQAMQDLEAARRTLEDRVEQRTRALESAQGTLLRAERMNTVALMGAGLAHDLNNLLCAVKSSADLALLNLEDGVAPGEKELNRISLAADRAAVLTRRLMGFARREREELMPMNLGREVREMEVTLRFLLPRTVELHIDAPTEDDLVVHGSRLRLEQMLVNLVANAVDAMPDGGVLGIRVARGGPAEDLAMIEVSDSGIGMAPKIQAQIFDPFFTTKAPGKGTGLGLPTLKATVEEGGGRLEVDSEPGQGSRFRILLPVHSMDEISPR